MSVRIERIVYRHTMSRPRGHIRFHHRISSAVGEHQIVAWNEGPERIGRILLKPIQRSRSIDVPENHPRLAALQIQNRALQQFIVYANAAGLDYQISAARLLDHS